ncbi:MAG: Modification methylase DpnIIA [Syntrophomonadaceae bacterium]|nr:Modification methylase DpnIIA [Bacillota bacterium]
MRSPLVWVGGKFYLAKAIIGLFPPHKCYVEVFGGAGHVLMQKYRSPVEVYNDINGEVVNFFLQLRDRPEELKRKCELSPYSRALYEAWKKDPLPDDPLERAARFFFLLRSSMNKGWPLTGWAHSKKKNSASFYHSGIAQFLEVAKRLFAVQIECKDFRYIIDTYDSLETLFYCDPPYVELEHYYAGGFNEQDHRDLAAKLNNIQGKAIVSYYPHSLVDELYKGWRKEEVQCVKHSEGLTKNNDKAMRARSVELLLMNYPRPQVNYPIAKARGL